jgi:hypothetical protein
VSIITTDGSNRESQFISADKQYATIQDITASNTKVYIVGQNDTASFMAIASVSGSDIAAKENVKSLASSSFVDFFWFIAYAACFFAGFMFITK